MIYTKFFLTLHQINVNYTYLTEMKLMKRFNFMAVATLVCGMALSGCGNAGMYNGTGFNGQNANGSNVGADLLGAALSGLVGGNAQQGDLLSGVIGMLANGVTSNSGSIVGTWVYSGPSVEFESQNLLAQAGGMVASNQLKNKIAPYYEKIGIKPGAVAMQFNSDNTCIIQIGKNAQPANYTYNPSTHTLQITGQQLGLSFGTAYATVSGSQMSITFDSTKILNVAQGLASKSGNSTLSTISELSKTFSGMKTGFLFVKQ